MKKLFSETREESEKKVTKLHSIQSIVNLTLFSEFSSQIFRQNHNYKYSCSHPSQDQLVFGNMCQTLIYYHIFIVINTIFHKVNGSTVRTISDPKRQKKSYSKNDIRKDSCTTK